MLITHGINQPIEKLERELAEIKVESSRRSTFLMDQIKLKDERIDRLMTRVDVLLKQVQDLLQKMS